MTNEIEVELKDKPEKPEPSYAPVYCAIYPDLAKIAREHGYALAIHGSLQRDFDLVCVPWIVEPSSPQVVVDEIVSRYNFSFFQPFPPKMMLHGRLCYTLVYGHTAFLDLSFMPYVKEFVEPDLLSGLIDQMKASGFNPDYVSPPGETLLELLEMLGVSQVELSRQLGRPKKTINEIIKGKVAITPQTALQLEAWYPRISARFWLMRELDYRLGLARNRED